MLYTRTVCNDHVEAAVKQALQIHLQPSEGKHDNSMCVCVYLCMYLCVFVYVSLCVSVYLYVCVCILCEHTSRLLLSSCMDRIISHIL